MAVAVTSASPVSTPSWVRLTRPVQRLSARPQRRQRRQVRLAGDEVEERVAPGDPARVQARLAPLGLGQLLRVLGVAAARPRRVEPREPDRPDVATIGTNKPITPLQILPLNRQNSTGTITTATQTARAMRNTSPLSPGSPRSPNGFMPSTNNAAAQTTMMTASTESRPSLRQYTSCRFRMRANSSSVSATPTPKSSARTWASRSSGCRAMRQTPTVTISTTPMTMWCTCVPPSPSMSWNHQLTLARISRVLMRTKRKVASRPTRNPAIAERGPSSHAAPRASAATCSI